MKPLLTLLTLLFALLACNDTVDRDQKISQSKQSVQFSSSLIDVEKAFSWAKEKALSFAHDGSDPVGFWYEAALPNREAFCMRDVSHQAIGAEILGLGDHNFNMMLKFAQNISESRDFCSFWEINRYDLPAPVDYVSDDDFWYNLPANFDVIFNLKRLYDWTGNTQYLYAKDFTEFYRVSLNEYVDHWDLGHDEVLLRDRFMHLVGSDSSEFGSHKGIPTYNEGGKGIARLGIDMTAALVAAYKSYSDVLKYKNDRSTSDVFARKAEAELDFLQEFWWDSDQNEFRSIWYQDSTFDHFLVGTNQAFLHYLLYFDVLHDSAQIVQLVHDYENHYDQLIVELKSYIPIIFYEYGNPQLANEMIVELCDEENTRRDYPENSFTIVEHIIRGLMGVEALAADTTLSTISRLVERDDWTEIRDLPILGGVVDVRHDGRQKSTLTNRGVPDLIWEVQFRGIYDILYVDGVKKESDISENFQGPITSIKIPVAIGQVCSVAVYDK